MEVNHLTYIIFKFLEKKGWIYVPNNDTKFIFLKCDVKIGLPEKFNLKLPISNKSKDFYSYISGIINLLEELYPKNVKDVSKFTDLNEKLKNRYTKHWVVPDYRSRIEKIDKFEPYFPHKTS